MNNSTKHEWSVTELENTDISSIGIEELRELRKVLNKEYHHAKGEFKRRLGNLDTKVTMELFQRWEVRKNVS